MATAATKSEHMADEIESGAIKTIEVLREQTRGFLDSIHTPDLSEELHKIQAQLNDIGRRVQHSAKKVDRHVHTNPYAYLAGAFGAGLLTAQLTRLGKSRKNSH